MGHLSSIAGALAGSALLVVIASACGGKSVDPGGDGGTSTGATSSDAGSGPAAGKSAGGGSPGVGGGVTGTGGATGTGGTLGVAGTASGGGSGGYPAACNAPAATGPCNAYVPSWYHDASTGICRPFVYGGCGGNANRYDSLGACQMSCRGGNPDQDACTRPSECLIAGKDCCGVCDTPGLTKHDFVAYHRMFQAQQCGWIPLDLPGPGAPSGAPIDCAGCPEVAGGYLKYFVPDCVQGACAVDDLRDAQFTTCSTDEDCTYRRGTGCCQTCNNADAIALRKDAQLESLFCDGPVACAPCPPGDGQAPPYPRCNADKRCELVYIAF